MVYRIFPHESKRRAVIASKTIDHSARIFVDTLLNSRKNSHSGIEQISENATHYLAPAPSIMLSSRRVTTEITIECSELGILFCNCETSNENN